MLKGKDVLFDNFTVIINRLALKELMKRFLLHKIEN